MMQILIDTNILLWYFESSNRVNPIKELISSENSQVFISTVSWWEIAIKIRAGKLQLDYGVIRSFAKKYNFPELPITSDSLKVYLELPDLHKDPFDHMLLSQAISCPMRLITGDAILAEYSPLVMVV